MPRRYLHNFTSGKKRDHATSQDLKAVVDIADRLITSNDLDSLLRNAVELARSQLRVERCSILINRDDHLRGSYGTNTEGTTTDERSKIVKLDDAWIDRFNLWNSKSSQWIIERDIKRSSPDARESGVEGFWVATTPIKGSNNKVIAVFCNDTVITQSPPDENLQDVIAVFCSLLGSIIERQTSIDELQLRDNVLEGVANAISRLLSEEGFSDAITDSLRILGEAIKVDRTYIFKNRRDPLTDEWFTSQLYEWASDPRIAEFDNPELQGVPYEPVLNSMFDCLSNGRIYGGPVSTLPQSEQKFLEPQNILSLLNVPIFVNNEFWGFIGFDDCQRPREWNNYEKSSLLTMAGSLGSAITRSLTENELKSRDRILSGVAAANQELLTNTNLDRAIENALRILAAAVDIERIYVCENTLDLMNGGPVMCPRYILNKTTDKCDRYALLERQLSYADHFPGWHRIMSAGKPIHGRVLDFLSKESQDVRSVLLSPLMVEGSFWGVIGFDSADPEHDWSASDVSTLTTMAGSIVGAIARERAEKFLRTSEEHFRSLIDNASDMILIVNDRGQILYGSPSTERTLGSRTTVLPRINFLDIINPDDWPSVRHIFRDKDTLKQQPELHQLRLHHDEGQWIHTETTITVMQNEQEAARFIINARDITQRVNAEEALKKSNDLLQHAQKMEAIGRLAGGISHDFNNLLTAILGYSDLLISQIPKAHHWRKEVEEIHSAAQRAHTLTKQLLAFSRRQVMEPKHLDLNLVVTDMERLLVRLIGEHVTLVTNITKVECPVKVDRSQIEQVIINLAINARDAMETGGTLNISTELTQLDTPISEGMVTIQPGEYVLLKVADSGHGISDEVRPHIFEPFFTTKDIGKGTGLGLSMVYGTIKQSGGHILFNSEVRKGTEFTIYFPRVELKEQYTAKKSVQSGVQGNETILLIEDEPFVRELSVKILEIQGYRVVAKENGQLGLDYFKKHVDEIDMVLTDIIMPQMSGVSFARSARKLRPELRILFMSGYSEDHQPELQETANGRNYIQKPFTVASLCSRIREILDSPAEKTA